MLLFTNISEILAVEVSDIRFGETKQLLRIVIDSDEPVTVEEIWKPDGLELILLDISKPLSTSTLSERASEVGIKVVTSNNVTQIIIPFNKKSFIGKFNLRSTDKLPYRLVFDWNPESAETVTKALDTMTIQEEHIQSTPKEVAVTEGISKVQKTETKQKSLRQRSETALNNKEYKLAITLLTSLLDKGTDDDKHFATEFLGVARERNYQLAFAKQYYNQFLTNYPDSPNVARVTQRLNSLIGIQEMTNKKELKSGKNSTSRSKDFTRGSIATDYRFSRLVDDLDNSRDTLSLISLDIDYRGQYEVESGTVKARFSGGHIEDLLPEGTSSSELLRYANIGWKSTDKAYSAEIGRMRSRGKGIFGRFDGILLGYGFNDNQKINVVAGFPVASSRVLSLDPERTFVGVSFDWEELFPDLDISIFLLNQTINSLTDRQAIGGQFKYYNQGISLFGMIDYDIFYAELNALLISGSYRAKNDFRYNWSMNLRKSPYISTRNALVGQASDSLEELQELFLTEEEILDLAVDRTLESKTATFQVSKSINETFDLNTSVTWMDISGAPASGGVAEMIDPDGSIYFNIYLGARKLYSESDSHQLGLRLSKLSNSDVFSIFGNSQYKFSKAWRLRAKLRYDDRTSDNGSEQQSISPGIRLQFQNRNNYIYAELGAIFYTHQNSGFDEVKTDIYFAYLGYRYYF
ncbi:MAG: hypothetical protein GY781_14665 [Gammaproteobacteria bacterium]|nr:hypothetical protein [Gammaproteobacteria bacterium]